MTDHKNSTEKQYEEPLEIPKEFLDRSKVQDALIFVSEQNIHLYSKVNLLIGYGRALNRTFSFAEIEFALKEHEPINGKEE